MANTPKVMRSRKTGNPVSNVMAKASQGLQNYGKNIRRNVSANQKAFQGRTSNAGYYATKNPFPNPLKGASYKAK